MVLYYIFLYLAWNSCIKLVPHQLTVILGLVSTKAVFLGNSYPENPVVTFSDIMHTSGFRLLDFTPNAVACTALFAHLCEGFAGVHPGEAFAEVREKGRARHRIRGKIQEAEAGGVHDVAKCHDRIFGI